jgi:5-methylcytosine-specific restriction protein A
MTNNHNLFPLPYWAPALRRVPIPLEALNEVYSYGERRHHRKTRSELPWRSWFKSPIWKSIRRHRLAQEPWCRQCAIDGRTVTASYIDHVEPHKGECSAFFKYENTQSLCAHHHKMHHRGNPSKKSMKPPTSH